MPARPARPGWYSSSRSFYNPFVSICLCMSPYPFIIESAVHLSILFGPGFPSFQAFPCCRGDSFFPEGACTLC